MLIQGSHSNSFQVPHAMARTCHVFFACISLAANGLADSELSKFMGKVFVPAVPVVRPASPVRPVGKIVASSLGAARIALFPNSSALKNMQRKLDQLEEESLAMKVELQQFSSQITTITARVQSQRQIEVADTIGPQLARVFGIVAVAGAWLYFIIDRLARRCPSGIKMGMAPSCNYRDVKGGSPCRPTYGTALCATRCRSPMMTKREYFRDTAEEVRRLGIALHAQLAQHAPVVQRKQWLETASLLRDACEGLAVEIRFAERGPESEVVAMAREVAESLVAATSDAHPELYAVAKFSLKHNGRLASGRDCERGLAELGLLIGTYTALLAHERPLFLAAARPIAQTTRTHWRFRTLMVLCRGFHTPEEPSWSGGTCVDLLCLPGFSKRADTWRVGKGIGAARHSHPAAPAESACPTQLDAFETWLRTDAPERLRRHSRVLRAAHPMLDKPLQLWLQACEARGQGLVETASVMACDAASIKGGEAEGAVEAKLLSSFTAWRAPESAASALLSKLVEDAGDEGVHTAKAIGRWVIDTLVDVIDPPDDRPSSGPGSSNVARLLLRSHGPLVQCKQKHWRDAVDRVGHAVWLMLLAADQATREARRAEPEAATTGGGGGTTSAGVTTHAARTNAAAAGAVVVDNNDDDKHARLVIERVRAVMLSCTLLEQSDGLRPKYREAMNDVHTDPACLWNLFTEELALHATPSDSSDAPVGNPVYAFDASNGDVNETSPGAIDADAAADVELSSGTVAHGEQLGWIDADVVTAACSRLLRWPKPELLFKYTAMHPYEKDPAVAEVARRWVAAVLGLGRESVHAMRCHAEPNAKHFAWLAASGRAARRAVAMWIRADQQSNDKGHGPVDKPQVAASGAITDGSALLGNLLSDDLASGPALSVGTCDTQKFFINVDEMKTCLRIDADLTETNSALLGYLAQGHTRMLMVYVDDKHNEEGTSEGINSGSRQQVAARSTAKLLGREDTAAPVLYLDRPEFGPDVCGRFKADANDARREALHQRLISMGSALALELGIPVVPWTRCLSSPFNPYRSSLVGLIELDGLAPVVPSNIRRLMLRRGSLEASLVKPNDPIDYERVVVHAWASLADLG